MKPFNFLCTYCKIWFYAIPLFLLIASSAVAQDKVGINTDSPVFTLDVFGQSHTFGRIKSLNGYSGLILDRSADANNAYVIYRTQGIDRWTIGMIANNHFSLTNWLNGSTAFTVNASSNFLGLGINDPAFRLDVSGRMRLRATNETAGIWLNNSSNTISNGFIGVSDDNHIGLWGNTGAGWSVVMNTDNGNLGVKNANPQSELHIIHGIGSGASFGLRIQNSGNNNNQWALYTVNGSGNLELYRNGLFRGSYDANSGAYTAASDARLKKNIQPAADMLPLIMSLNVKRYQFKNSLSDRNYYGLLAQEVEKVFPEVVYHNQGDDGSEYYSMDYSALGVIAIKGLQEMKPLLDTQQAEINALRHQNKLLQQQIDELKQLVLATKRQ